MELGSLYKKACIGISILPNILEDVVKIYRNIFPPKIDNGSIEVPMISSVAVYLKTTYLHVQNGCFPKKYWEWSNNFSPGASSPDPQLPFYPFHSWSYHCSAEPPLCLASFALLPPHRTFRQKIYVDLIAMVVILMLVGFVKFFKHFNESVESGEYTPKMLIGRFINVALLYQCRSIKVKSLHFLSLLVMLLSRLVS